MSYWYRVFAAITQAFNAPRGSGVTSIAWFSSSPCPPGNDGVIWIFLE